MTGHETQLRSDILLILTAAVSAVDPHGAILANLAVEDRALRVGSRRYPLAGLDRIIVVGGGKAGTPMAAAVCEALGDRVSAGAVNVKYEHTAAAGGWQVRFGRGGEAHPPTRRAATGPIAIVEAGHPVPDAAGLRGAEQIAGLLTGLTPRDLVLVLISGGGSALLPLP
ncbi:MAG: glycerate-2-kinase family protein, partial [Anaerolineae bacterium]|nr:glycerate-2-kinase family protein [Anaerolineae bacterium]